MHEEPNGGRRWHEAMARSGSEGDAATRALEEQLGRMRGMLYAYSALFFRQITVWAIVSIGLVALSAISTPVVVAFVPFIVPFAFLEAGYYFYYTVFARRHAEFLERAINARSGSDLLVAHRLEAAYFYEPSAPKLAFLSFARVGGYGSAMTIGYSVGAILLWGAAMHRSLALVAGGNLPPVVPLAASLWTLGVTLYLLWHFLGRRDEERLLAALRASYPDAVRSPRTTSGTSHGTKRSLRSRARRSKGA